MPTLIAMEPIERRKVEGRVDVVRCLRCSLCMALLHERRMSWASLAGLQLWALKVFRIVSVSSDFFRLLSLSLTLRQTCNIIRNTTLLYLLAAPFRCRLLCAPELYQGYHRSVDFALVFCTMESSWKYHYILITNRIYVHFYLIFFLVRLFEIYLFRFNSARLVAFRGRLGLSSSTWMHESG